MHRLLLPVLLLTACAGPPTVQDGASTREGPTCTPAPAVSGTPPALVPPLPAGAVLTEVGSDVVSARVERPLDAVVAELRASLEGDGWVVTREEDEQRAVRLGFFGVRGSGTASLAALSCPPASTALSVRVVQVAG